MWMMEKGCKGHASGSWKEKYKVPAQTVANYMKLDPATRKPRWHAVEATNTFTKTGKPPTLNLPGIVEVWYVRVRLFTCYSEFASS